MTTKNDSNNLKGILDSDDELPTEYVDLPFVPAYVNEKRFENIQERKKNKAPSNKKRKDQLSGRKIISDGYLNERDTFCLQCLEPVIGEEALVWFFNFLKRKDLQSSFKFLSTCLVSSYDVSDFSKAVVDRPEDSHRYKLITTKIL